MSLMYFIKSERMYAYDVSWSLFGITIVSRITSIAERNHGEKLIPRWRDTDTYLMVINIVICHRTNQLRAEINIQKQSG